MNYRVQQPQPNRRNNRYSRPAPRYYARQPIPRQVVYVNPQQQRILTEQELQRIEKEKKHKEAQKRKAIDKHPTTLAAMIVGVVASVAALTRLFILLIMIVLRDSMNKASIMKFGIPWELIILSIVGLYCFSLKQRFTHPTTKGVISLILNIFSLAVALILSVLYIIVKIKY